MGPTPGCQCSECVAAWTAALVLYAMKLESAAKRIKIMIDNGADVAAYQLIEKAAELAAEQDLCGELKLEQEVRNLRTAAEIRRAGRLN